MGPAAQPSRRDRGAVWARREAVRRRVAFVPAGKKNLLLHADVLEQTRAKLGISRGVDILRIGHSALEQGIEAPVIVGEIAVDFSEHQTVPPKMPNAQGRRDPFIAEVRNPGLRRAGVAAPRCETSFSGVWSELDVDEQRYLTLRVSELAHVCHHRAGSKHSRLFRQRTAVLQHLPLFIFGKLLVRRHLARAFSDTFNNASSDFCFVSLPTMLSSFSPKVLANAGLPFSSAPWQAAQFFS